MLVYNGCVNCDHGYPQEVQGVCWTGHETETVLRYVEALLLLCAASPLPPSLPTSLPPPSHDSCTPQSPSPGDIGVHLPSKRPLRNMDPAFVENRQKELEQYLRVCHRPSHPHTLTPSHLTPSSSHPHIPHPTQALISLPGVQSSQLLASFLTDSSDPTLFIPDSVSDKAGRQPLSISSHALTYSHPCTQCGGTSPPSRHAL